MINKSTLCVILKICDQIVAIFKNVISKTRKLSDFIARTCIIIYNKDLSLIREYFWHKQPVRPGLANWLAK